MWLRGASSTKPASPFAQNSRLEKALHLRAHISRLAHARKVSGSLLNREFCKKHQKQTRCLHVTEGLLLLLFILLLALRFFCRKWKNERAMSFEALIWRGKSFVVGPSRRPESWLRTIRIRRRKTSRYLLAGIGRARLGSCFKKFASRWSERKTSSMIDVARVVN
jgi:hypothetical protein